MGAVHVDRNAAAYITAQGSVNVWQIIRVGLSSFVPCPYIFIGVDYNIAIDGIIAHSTGHSCKAVACAHDGPVAVQPQSPVRVLVVRRTGDDMQVAADDGRIDELLRAADLVGPAGTNVQRHIAPHLTAVSALDGRCGSAVLVIIDQRCIAADIHIGDVCSIAAGTITLDAAGVQMVAALHFNLARDLQVGVTLNGALIGTTDHIVQTAGRGRVDIAAGGNHYISVVHCGFVAAAVECFA